MNQSIFKKTDVEIQKVILSGLQVNNYPLSHGIEDIVHELLRLSNIDFSQTIYIELATQYIHAYLQLGFGYLEHKDLFDTLLGKAGFSAEYISNLQRSNPVIRLNKSKIRSLIGRWPASPYNSHTVTETVDEIITHAFNRDIGVYNYYTSKKDGSYTALYRLTVSNDYILFHDVFQNKYYELVKE